MSYDAEVGRYDADDAQQADPSGNRADPQQDDAGERRPADPAATGGAAGDGARPAPPPERRWRVPAAAAAVIVGVQVLFVFCLGYPPLHASPHEVPIGVAGPPAAVEALSAPLAGQPGAFDVHRYPDLAAARSAVRNRDVYGALVAAHGRVRLLVASAADPKVAAMLTSKATALARGSSVAVTDLVPAPKKDPEGSGSLTTLLPLILVSLALGAVLALGERRRRRMLGWCAAASAVAGLGVSGVAGGLGTFVGSYWADAGVLALLVFGLSAASAGLVSVKPLRPLMGLLALTMLLFGIPSAGALVPPQLLPQPWRAIGPDLPPAAALDALRGITFFDGAAIGRSLAVLGSWAGLGALLLALGRTAAPRRPAAGRNHQP